MTQAWYGRGPKGASISAGSGAPSGGSDGDMYVRTSNGDLYSRAAGTWSVVGNIKGPPGDDAGGSDLVADTSPQLGGDLDLNGHKVGAATAADLTKLHGAGALSGDNSGDQDLSGLVPNSRTVAGKPLSANVSLDKFDVGLSNVTNNAQYYPGGSDVAVADGGTGASSASAARTNLGLGSLATVTPTGTADSTTVLYGDNVYRTPPSGGGGGSGEFDSNLYIEKDSPEIHLTATNAGDQEWSLFINGSGQLGIYDETAGKGPFRIYPDTPVDTFVLESAGLRTSMPIRYTGDVAAARAELGLGSVDLRGATATASSATPAFDVSVYRQLSITALAAAITSLSSGISGTGSLPDGAPIMVRIKDNGTARAITLGSLWREMGVAAPTTTVAGKTMYLSGRWNATDSVIDLVGVAMQA